MPPMIRNLSCSSSRSPWMRLRRGKRKAGLAAWCLTAVERNSQSDCRCGCRSERGEYGSSVRACLPSGSCVPRAWRLCCCCCCLGVRSGSRSCLPRACCAPDRQSRCSGAVPALPRRATSSPTARATSDYRPGARASPASSFFLISPCRSRWCFAAAGLSDTTLLAASVISSAMANAQQPSRGCRRAC